MMPVAIDTLSGLMRKEPENILDENQVRIIIKQVASALSFVHQRAFIHCYVKLDNILKFGDKQ